MTRWRVAIVMAGAFFVGTATVAFAGAEPGAAIVTHHETIPNPVFGSSFRVAAPCLAPPLPCPWEAPETWTAGRLPGLGDRVIVDGRVRIGVAQAVALEVGVYPGGELSFRPDVVTRLATGSLLVTPGGRLTIGTSAAPIGDLVNAELVFRDLAFDSADTAQHLRGLVAVDGVVEMFGRALAQPYLRLETEALAGANQIVLTESALAAGWRVGDTLVMPRSAQCPLETLGFCADETEDRTLVGISADGLTVTLSAPLTFDHPAARDLAGALAYSPHLLATSRNVVVRSENPNGVRGHVLLHGRSVVDLRYVAFVGLGRTTIANLGPTNQKGRYPLHLHHLIGPVAPLANGYQFTLIGNVVDFAPGNTAQGRKWGLAVHGSHYGLLERNIVDRASGAAFATEDASETGNVFRANFAVRVVGGNGDRTEDRDPSDGSKLGRAGVAYWFNGGGGNFYEDNIAAAVAECTYCYGFKFDNVYNGTVTLPQVQGADPHHQGVERDSATIALADFRRNEAYGVPNGLTIWWVCTEYESPRDVCASQVEDFVVWHHHRWGYFAYETNQMLLDRMVVRGDPAVLDNPYELVMGLHLVDYFQRRTVIRGADIQNVATAVVAPVNRDVRGSSGRWVGHTVIEDSLLAGGTNVAIYAPSSTNGSANLAPQTLELRNVRFAHPANRDGPDLVVSGQGAPGSTSANVDLRNDVWSFDHGAAPGEDGPDLYLVPAYQSAAACEGDLGDCATNWTALFPELTGVSVHPLTLSSALLLVDGFESGDVSAWSSPAR